MADRLVRERVRRELAAGGKVFTGSAGIRDVRIGNFRRPENRPWESRTLGEYLDAAGRDPVDAIADLILAEDLCANMIVPGPHLDGIRTFLRHPSGMVGSDAILIADKPSPRTYGTFPRILGQFVRDEGLVGLEEAVRRMTSLAAERFGFRDRGVLRDGAIADVTVFDPARVRANATYDEPRQFPDGIDYVIVNGTPSSMTAATQARRPADRCAAAATEGARWSHSGFLRFADSGRYVRTGFRAPRAGFGVDLGRPTDGGGKRGGIGA